MQKISIIIKSWLPYEIVEDSQSNLTKGSVHTKDLRQCGKHVMLIHVRISTLSKAYSHYTKNQLLNNNEVGYY